MRLYKQLLVPADKVEHQLAEDYKHAAGRYWDLFYKRNGDKFFKDRHYFDKEFPELLQGALTVLEVGCGVGNSVFPLIDINPQIQVYACDFSPTAVQLVRSHPQYTNSGRVKAFVADITADPLLEQLPGRVVDFCSMVFVLSAVAPEKMPQAIQNVASVLKSGTGRVLFRDYAAGDLAQTRLEEAAGMKFINDSFYVRGDGTCCFYYTEEGLKALFAEQGFVCESVVVHARLIENRKSGVQMNRRWIQAVFRYDAPNDFTKHQQQQQEQQQCRQAASASALPGQPHQPSDDVCPQSAQQKQQQQQQQQQTFLRQLTGSRHMMRFGSRQWTLPGCLAGSAIELLGTHIAQLAEHQGCLPLLGKRLLLAPPWLQLHSQGRQPGPSAEVLQQLQWHPQRQQTVLPPVLAEDGRQVLCNPWVVDAQQCFALPDVTGLPSQRDQSSREDLSHHHHHYHHHQQQQQRLVEQGAGAALFALMAVWYGAQRVYVCLPDMLGPYAAAFQAVVQLNECSVVCERLRMRVWQPGEPRQLQMLQRELLCAAGDDEQQQAPIDMVVASCCLHSQPQQLAGVQAQAQITGHWAATPAGHASTDDTDAVSRCELRAGHQWHAGDKAAAAAAGVLLDAVLAFMQQLADVLAQKHSGQDSLLPLLSLDYLSQ